MLRGYSAAVALVVGVACGPSVLGPELEDGSRLDCDALCEVTLPEGCLSPPAGQPDACQNECATVLEGQPEAARSAFEACAATNPLCFISTEDCMWGHLYADPFPQTIELRGVSFDHLEAAGVYLWLGDPSEPLVATQAAISDGTFSVSFHLEAPMQVERTVYGYVDVDGDGMCSPEIDFGIYEGVGVSGPFDEPTFEHELSAVDGSKAFICGSIGSGR